jgi:membrane protein implicated in regulation of membrane protease activity
MFESLLMFLFTWYNLPFTLMLGLGVLLAGLQLFGLSHDGDTDADAHVDADGDVDVHVDMDHDVDLHLDHDADLHLDHDADLHLDHSVDHDVAHDIGHDTDHDVSHAAPSGFSWLAFIGIGKAPLMVVVLILLMTTGLLGWFINGLAAGVLGFFPALLLLATFLVSLVAGSLITSRVTRFIGRALPPVSTTATRAQALVGRPGTVTSPFVDHRYGLVRLRDDGGTLISLFAVTEDAEPIPRGEPVILLSYDTKQRLYLVTRR